MIIAISSILILTAIIWLISKKLPFRICPICAGTTLTWAGIFLGMFFGKLPISDYQVPFAILAGGTVVGAMSKLEERIKVKFILAWKTIFVVSGFGIVYSLVAGKWALVGFGIFLNVLITLYFKKSKKHWGTGKAKELEEKMKSCC
ncbi:MAG TPA: hypothetical protein VJH06_00445 [Candidatus Paceibacterota bacterium]